MRRDRFLSQTVDDDEEEVDEEKEEGRCISEGVAPSTGAPRARDGERRNSPPRSLAPTPARTPPSVEPPTPPWTRRRAGTSARPGDDDDDDDDVDESEFALAALDSLSAGLPSISIAARGVIYSHPPRPESLPRDGDELGDVERAGVAAFAPVKPPRLESIRWWPTPSSRTPPASAPPARPRPRRPLSKS